MTKKLNDVERFWLLVNKQDGASDTCWLWNGGGRGNGYAGFRPRGQKAMDYAHKYAYFQGRGRRYNRRYIFRNTCGNRMCVNWNHWEIQGKRSSGRGSKLSLDKIREIRYNYNALQNALRSVTLKFGVKLTDIPIGARLGRKYNLAKSTIHNIVHRKGIYKDI